MSRLFGLLALALLMFLLVSLPAATSGAPLSMLLGFLMLAAFACGKLGNRIGLPGITGYLLAGLALGPSCFGVLKQEAIADLTLINSFALTLIALTAGGEVNLGRIRKRLASFLLITSTQVVLTFSGVLLSMLAALHFFQGVFSLGFIGLFAVSALFAVTAISTSPSATVAVIVETRAKGPLSELVLGITIVKDILVIVAFALTLGAAGQTLGQNLAGRTQPDLLARLSWEIGGSILFGLALGMGIIAYMRYVSAEITLFIIGLSFCASTASQSIHLHALLVCMVAGLAVNNLSRRGEDFIRAIEKGSLPLYVIFFAIAGASINLEILSSGWKLVAILVASRIFFFWLGTSAGAAMARERPEIKQNLWLGFITQAGITLGIAVVVAENFGALGVVFKNLVIGAVAIFELVGPVAFKFALGRAGEIPRKRRPSAR